MCTAALKEDLNQSIDLLPAESVRLLIEVAKSMKPSAASASGTSGSNHAGVVVERQIEAYA